MWTAWQLASDELPHESERFVSLTLELARRECAEPGREGPRVLPAAIERLLDLDERGTLQALAFQLEASGAPAVDVALVQQAASSR